MNKMSRWFINFLVNKAMELVIVEVKETKDEWILSPDGERILVNRKIEFKYCIRERGKDEDIICFPTYKQAFDDLEFMKKNLKEQDAPGGIPG